MFPKRSLHLSCTLAKAPIFQRKHFSALNKNFAAGLLSVGTENIFFISVGSGSNLNTAAIASL